MRIRERTLFSRVRSRTGGSDEDSNERNARRLFSPILIERFVASLGRFDGLMARCLLVCKRVICCFLTSLYSGLTLRLNINDNVKKV
jgi:hypothetical protein